jgi:hypothetical protein
MHATQELYHLSPTISPHTIFFSVLLYLGGLSSPFFLQEEKWDKSKIFVFKGGGVFKFWKIQVMPLNQFCHLLLGLS